MPSLACYYFHFAARYYRIRHPRGPRKSFANIARRKKFVSGMLARRYSIWEPGVLLTMIISLLMEPLPWPGRSRNPGGLYRILQEMNRSR